MGLTRYGSSRRGRKVKWKKAGEYEVWLGPADKAKDIIAQSDSCLVINLKNIMERIEMNIKNLQGEKK
jgi:hypothetical protein